MSLPVECCCACPNRVLSRLAFPPRLRSEGTVCVAEVCWRKRAGARESLEHPPEVDTRSNLRSDSAWTAAAARPGRDAARHFGFGAATRTAVIVCRSQDSWNKGGREDKTQRTWKSAYGELQMVKVLERSISLQTRTNERIDTPSVVGADSARVGQNRTETGGTDAKRER